MQPEQKSKVFKSFNDLKHPEALPESEAPESRSKPSLKARDKKEDSAKRKGTTRQGYKGKEAKKPAIKKKPVVFSYQPRKFHRIFRQGIDACKTRNYEGALLQFNQAIEYSLKALRELSDSVKNSPSAGSQESEGSLIAEKVIPHLIMVLFERGQTLWHQKNWEAALEDLNRVLKYDPDHLKALKFRAKLYHLNGKWDEAILDLESVLKKQGEDFQAAYRLGDILMGQGHSEQALDRFRQGLKYDPNHPKHHFRKGKQAARRNQTDRALHELDHAIFKTEKLLRHVRGGNESGECFATDGAHAQALHLPLLKSLLNRGDIHRHTGDFEKALADYGRALSYTPRDPDILFKRVETAMALGQNELALKDLDCLIEEQPEKASNYLKRAEARAALDQVEEALLDYSKAIALEPYKIPVYAKRGELFETAGKWNEAIDDLTHVLEFKPGNASLHRKRAGLYLKIGKREEAIQDFKAALQLDPDSAQHNLEKAESFRAKGDLSQALHFFSETIRKAEVLRNLLDPRKESSGGAERWDAERGRFLDSLGLDLCKAFFHRGILNRETGQMEKCLADLTIAEQLDRGHIYPFLLERGKTYLALGQPRKARQDLLACTRGDNAKAESFYAMGNLEQFEGHHEQAIKNYHKAIKCNPTGGEFHRALGLILKQNGSLETSLYHFTKAAELDKTDAEAWWGIGSLHCDIANTAHFDARLGQEFLEKALSLEKRPEWQADLAKACSLNGSFELAVTHQENAWKHSGQERDKKMLEHYQQGKSFASFQDDVSDTSS